MQERYVLKDIYFRPEPPQLTFEKHSKKLLGMAIFNDTLFLQRNDVMDYSLMVAVDEVFHPVIFTCFILTLTGSERTCRWYHRCRADIYLGMFRLRISYGPMDD